MIGLEKVGERVSGVELMEALIKITPYIAEILQQDLGFAVTDREKFIIQKDGEHVRLNIKPGDRVNEKTAMYQAMQSKRPTMKILDASVYGLPILALGYPLLDENREVIGSIGVARNLDNRNRLVNSSEELHNLINDFSNIIYQLMDDAQKLSSINDQLKNLSAEADNKYKETDKILSMTKEIASQINLIGLNAAIESARIGEMGRGFNVVATEIRRLSTSSNDANERITQIIVDMQNSLQKIVVGINQTSETAAQQYNDLNNIQSKLDELQAISTNLSQLANKI